MSSTLRPSFALVPAVVELLRTLGVPHDPDRVARSLRTHRDFPRAFCVLETLDAHGIEAEGVELDHDELDTLALPSLVHLRVGSEAGLVPVRSIGPNHVWCWLGSHGWCRLARSRFLALWSGVAIETRPSSATVVGELAPREPDRAALAATSALVVALVLAAVYAPALDGWRSSVVAGALLQIVGITVCVPLVAAHLGDTGTLGRWCPTRGRSSCAAVLHSRWGTIASIAIADLALVHFASRLLALAVAWCFGAHDLLLAALPWHALAGAIVALFAFVGQWLVVRRWCRLCLLAQLVLVLDLAVASVLAPAWSVPIDARAPALLAAVVLACVAIWIGVRRAVAGSLGNFATEEQLVRQLRDPGFLRAALRGAEGLAATPPGAFVLGSPDATVHVVLVAKLHCGACSSAVRELERLVAMHPDRLHARVVLLPERGELGTVWSTIMAELLAGRSQAARDLLREWYVDIHRPIASWTSARAAAPIDTAVLEAWRAWASAVDIPGTPLFFVDGRRLPLGCAVESVRALLFDLERGAP